MQNTLSSLKFTPSSPLLYGANDFNYYLIILNYFRSCSVVCTMPIHYDAGLCHRYYLCLCVRSLVPTIYACVYVHWCLLSIPVRICSLVHMPTIYACACTFTGAHYLCLCVYVHWCLLSMPVRVRSLVPTIYACVYMFTGAYYLCLCICSLVPTIYACVYMFTGAYILSMVLLVYL